MRLVEPNFRSYNMEFLFINGTRELVDGHGALETIEKEVDIKELKEIDKKNRRYGITKSKRTRYQSRSMHNRTKRSTNNRLTRKGRWN